MERAALLGMVLVTTGAIGLLSAEVIATAHAEPRSERAYLLAVSFGDDLPLIAEQSHARHRAQGGEVGLHVMRTLTCRRTFGVSGINVGYLCRTT